MLSRESYADSYKHTKLDYHATVRELPTNERPRERLQHFGPQALSIAELLAIILRTGTRGDNALELANKLLAKYGGLPGLVRADFRELCAEHGMGEAKSAQVKAALEIGRRLALVQADTRYKREGEPLPGHRQQLGLARRGGLPPRHYPQLPRPHPLPQPPQRRPDAVAGGYRIDQAATGGRPHPRHRAGRSHYHRPPALRKPERAFAVGVDRSCYDMAYMHLVRSWHCGHRGRLALHMSAPNSSTAPLTCRLRLPLTKRTPYRGRYPAGTPTPRACRERHPMLLDRLSKVLECHRLLSPEPERPERLLGALGGRLREVSPRRVALDESGVGPCDPGRGCPLQQDFRHNNLVRRPARIAPGEGAAVSLEPGEESPAQLGDAFARLRCECTWCVHLLP